MIWYIGILIVIFITWIIIEKIKMKNRKIWFLRIAFIELFLFLALRAIDVGTDLKNYVPFFQWYGEWPWSKVFYLEIEPSYALYNKIIATIFYNEQFFLIVTAAVCLIGVYFFIKNNSKDYLMSIFLYITLNFYIFLFSGLRQAIAISIVLFGFGFIKKGNIVKFLLTVLFAATFHISALIFIPAILIAYKKLTPRYVLTVSILSVLFLIFKEPILQFVTQFVYKGYTIKSESEGYGYLILLIGIFAVAYFLKKYVLKVDKEDIIWYNLFFVTIPLQIFATAQGNVARLVMYYSLSSIMLIPNVIENIKEQSILIKLGKKKIYLNKLVPIGKIVCVTFFVVFYIKSLSTYPQYKLFIM